MLLFTIVLVAATLPSPAAPCNATTEWTCTDTKCIPLQHYCDNVPDCDDASDETKCPLPPALSNFSAVIGDYGNHGGDLEQATFTWSTDSLKFTNVTVNVTYTDGATQQQESFLVYAVMRPCVDGKPCDNDTLCKTGYKYRCRKQCGLCRRDQVWARNWARFDMLSLLKKNATNIQGRAWASIYRGDGNTTEAITLHKPVLSGVGGLKANVMQKLQSLKEITTKLTWTNDSIVISKPYLDFGKTIWIYYNITKCRVVKGKKVDCEVLSQMAEILDRSKIYWEQKFSTAYSFSVKPYHSKYPDVVVGPCEDVYLNATMPNFGTKHGVDVVVMIIGVVGAFVISHLRWE